MPVKNKYFSICYSYTLMEKCCLGTSPVVLSVIVSDGCIGKCSQRMGTMSIQHCECLGDDLFTQMLILRQEFSLHCSCSSKQKYDIKIFKTLIELVLHCRWVLIITVGPGSWSFNICTIYFLLLEKKKKYQIPKILFTFEKACAKTTI